MGAALFMTLGVLTFVLGIPTLAYFQAKQMGRKPWPWLAISFVLPGISSIILSLLPDLSEDAPKTTTTKTSEEFSNS